jgi:EAL domain-containing protein (putative c-di-GMP-specific phosphodiesterase class I)
MNTAAHEYLHLVADLRQGLARQDFVLHYQPQYHLRTGAIIGTEALIRWQHPELGLVPPGTFIPVAERSGLIGEIGAWALREACRQAMAWRGRGLELIMAVNLSPAQFRRNDLELSLIRALEESGLPPSALELELTESMLILDAETVSQRLRTLRELGLSFAIDDFGTGYSNLGYLKKFDVERLKIDQSFVKHLTENAQDEALVVAIIQMAHALHLEVVAEGIETEAALFRLQELGCDMGQGFLWSRALPASEFEAFVAAARA